MIWQIFSVANRFCEIVQYKQKNLIPNIVVDKVVDIDKRRDTIANKEFNAITDKAINTDKTL